MFELVGGRLVEFAGVAPPADDAEPMAAPSRRSATRSPTAIATITLDRPEALNALTVPMKQALLAAFRTGGRATGRCGRSC